MYKIYHCINGNCSFFFFLCYFLYAKYMPLNEKIGFYTVLLENTFFLMLEAHLYCIFRKYSLCFFIINFSEYNSLKQKIVFCKQFHNLIAWFVQKLITRRFFTSNLNYFHFLGSFSWVKIIFKQNINQMSNPHSQDKK